MKKIITLLLILCAAFISLAQSNSYKQSNEYDCVKYLDWQTENADDWGSFFWQVHVTRKSDYSGLYYYYIYLYSNSYMPVRNEFGGYDRASTYIKDLNITMYETINGNIYNKVEVILPYATCDYTTAGYVAWFYSRSNHNTFRLNYSKVTAFDYSLY